MKTMELGVCSTFFLEQIHGGAGGVGCVWRRKFGVEQFFLDLELRGALPNTPLLLVVTTELLSWLVDLINCSKTSQKNNNRRLVV
jgi:hypothetical protein